mmetsp:Transcript_50542/g.114786  ORF Transcript_50542/g.114786 Transcript_50542/m.114786 type:complete len:222 (+) Transcript_50542:892-1557(+)
MTRRRAWVATGRLQKSSSTAALARDVTSAHAAWSLARAGRRSRPLVSRTCGSSRCALANADSAMTFVKSRSTARLLAQRFPSPRPSAEAPRVQQQRPNLRQPEADPHVGLRHTEVAQAVRGSGRLPRSSSSSCWRAATMAPSLATCRSSGVGPRAACRAAWPPGAPAPPSAASGSVVSCLYEVGPRRMAQLLAASEGPKPPPSVARALSSSPRKASPLCKA